MIEVIFTAFGVPMILFGLLLFLARFEASMVQPGEHAAQVVELLHSEDEPEVVERVTADMLATVVPVGRRLSSQER